MTRDKLRDELAGALGSVYPAYPERNPVDAIMPHIDAYVAAETAKALAEERQAIAAAIEALPGSDGEGIRRMPPKMTEGYLLAIEEAVRIARAGGESDGQL